MIIIIIIIITSSIITIRFTISIVIIMIGEWRRRAERLREIARE